MFLQVITRTFGKRPAMLEANRKSLMAQTNPDWEQTIVFDKEQRGVNWANANLGNVNAIGDYVWVLDDDDVCCCSTLVSELKVLTLKYRPNVIMVRANHQVCGMLPSDENWEKAPVLNNISWSCFIVKQDVWNYSGYQWQERYAEDFYFIDHLWKSFHRSFLWHNVIAAYYPQQSRGAGYAQRSKTSNGRDA